mgnify:CR=1 FL=1
MSETRKIIGKVKKIGDLQTFGRNGFKKRELILTVEDAYPQHICIEFVQDKTSLIDGLVVGQQVEVSFDLLGREWIDSEGTAKYFNSVQGWKVTVEDHAKIPGTPFAAVGTISEEEPNDLPF